MSRIRCIVMLSVWVCGIWGRDAQIEVGGAVLLTNKFCALEMYSLGNFDDSKKALFVPFHDESANACVRATSTGTGQTEQGFFRWSIRNTENPLVRSNMLELVCIENKKVIGTYTVVLPLRGNGPQKEMTGVVNEYSKPLSWVVKMTEGELYDFDNIAKDSTSTKEIKAGVDHLRMTCVVIKQRREVFLQIITTGNLPAGSLNPKWDGQNSLEYKNIDKPFTFFWTRNRV